LLDPVVDRVERNDRQNSQVDRCVRLDQLRGLTKDFCQLW